MVAKVIAHGCDRAEAIRRLTAALEDAPLLGLPTNGRFLRDLLNHDSFRQARMHTALLDEWAADGETILQHPLPQEADWQLAVALIAGDGGPRRGIPVTQSEGLRPASVAGFELTLTCGKETRRVRAGDTAVNILLQPLEDGCLRYTIDGLTRHAIIHRDGDTLRLARDAAVFTFTEASPFPSVAVHHDPHTARAAVAGTVARVEVAAGDGVEAGQTLAVIEAMKMEMRVTAGASGVVASVCVQVGQQVGAGAILVELTIREE
jgi:geranyl-CoA carboxylase alpha subunit